MSNKNEFKYDFPKFLAFRDREACERVRKIKKTDICNHLNPNFKISIIEERSDLFVDYAIDLVMEIKQSLEAGRRLVLILPAKVPEYAATLINELKLSCHHLHIFNMDEYADENGKSAPVEWPMSFQKMIRDNFLNKINPELRPPDTQIHFISSDNVNDYQKMIEDAGGTDVCYGQIGWSGHLAFWDPELGYQYEHDIEAFKQAGPATVELSPISVMQNSLYLSGAGDWSWHPPQAVTIGPAQVMQARRNSWRQYGYIGGDVAWQRFIVRLVAHGPVSPFVPASILQDHSNTDFKILGSVAENIVSPI
jgi:glucosamine-6-phosphate deaminase